MNACSLSEQLLYAWLDGEAGSHTAGVQVHVDGCGVCATRLMALKQAQRAMVENVQHGVGDLEPLLALQSIRRRIRVFEERGWWADGRDKLADLWLFNRRAVVAMALAVTAITGVTPWLWHTARHPAATPAMQPVHIESLRLQQNARTAVMHAAHSDLTVIWVHEAESIPWVLRATAAP